MTDLTDAARKRLTEFLGECPHDIEPLFGRCPNCGQGTLRAKRRTFSTPDDRQAVAERLMEADWWSSFRMYAVFAYDGEDLDIMDFAYWLLVQHPERFCWLAARFLEGVE